MSVTAISVLDAVCVVCGEPALTEERLSQRRAPRSDRAYCSSRCRKRAQRARERNESAERAETYLDREEGAFDWRCESADPNAFYLALDAITDPDGFRRMIEERRRRRDELQLFGVAA